MSTMPPTSCSRSAPLIDLSSPAASMSASHARRSCLGRCGFSLGARAAARESSVLCMVSSLFPVSRHPEAAALLRGPRRGTGNVEAIISPPPVEDMLEPLWRDGKLLDGARYPDGGLDRRRDHGAYRRDAAFARALDAERIERAWRLLGQDHLDAGRLARARHQVIGEAGGQRIAALVVEKFLVERAAEPLGEAADDLSLDQDRIDGTADVVADDVALDRHAAGLAVHANHRDMGAVGIDLVVDVEPALGRQSRLTAPTGLRCRLEAE